MAKFNGQVGFDSRYVRNNYTNNETIKPIDYNSLAKAVLDLITSNNNAEKASTYDVQQGVDDAKVVTPAKLKEAINYFNKGIIASSILGSRGYIKFYNNFIIQWDSSLGNKTVNFPIPFTSKNWVIATTLYTRGRTEGNYDDILPDSKTNSGFQWTDNELNTVKNYIAIGV